MMAFTYNGSNYMCQGFHLDVINDFGVAHSYWFESGHVTTVMFTFLSYCDVENGISSILICVSLYICHLPMKKVKYCL